MNKKLRSHMLSCRAERSVLLKPPIFFDSLHPKSKAPSLSRLP